jgi:two-component system LytT family response regulator
MKVLIVDDERLARVELRRLLAAHAGIEIVGEAANIEEAKTAIVELEPELLLLDI